MSFVKNFALSLTPLFLFCSPALACKVTAHASNPKLPVIIVDGWQNGDVCDISKFPPPFNVAFPTKQGPGIFAYHWKYEDKQYGYAYFNVPKSGKGTVLFEFSNKKPLDGDTFTAGFLLLDAFGKALFGTETQKGVNAGDVGYETKAVELTPEEWAKVAKIEFFHGRYQKEDDRKNWAAVTELLKAALQASGDSSE